jgi:hypothetical protein
MVIHGVMAQNAITVCKVVSACLILAKPISAQNHAVYQTWHRQAIVCDSSVRHVRHLQHSTVQHGTVGFAGFKKKHSTVGFAGFGKTHGSSSSWPKKRKKNLFFLNSTVGFAGFGKTHGSSSSWPKKKEKKFIFFKQVFGS